MLSPRIKLSSVIRRQIIEGVLAVVKVSRSHQYTRKISLQVFDRSGGSDNVRFNGKLSTAFFLFNQVLLLTFT